MYFSNTEQTRQTSMLFCDLGRVYKFSVLGLQENATLGTGNKNKVAFVRLDELKTIIENEHYKIYHRRTDPNFNYCQQVIAHLGLPPPYIRASP